MSVRAIAEDGNQSGVAAGWRRITVDGKPVYIHAKENITVLNEASTRKKIRRTTKLSPQTGTYVVQPHDVSLPPEWERAVVLQADTNTGTWIWHNLNTGGTTLKDPRQTIFENGDPLPAGWSIAFDEEGDVYFLDHNSGTVTYDDPRTVCPDAQNLEAEKVAQKVLATVQEDDEDADPDGASFSLPPISSDQPLRLSKLDHDAFNAMKQYLTPKSALPADVTVKALNRYSNILPNPETRVRLLDEYEPRTEISQYINANYIKGFNSDEVEYIATMGPLDNTVEAFWRMVWQVNAPAIVMTTPMMEQNVVKCARYWPTVKYNEEKQCGDKVWGNIRVAVTHGARHAGYILTRLRLTKGKEVRTLEHFWYQDWPDHGVPSKAGAAQVIAMMKTVRRLCDKKGGGPAIVHCSAGIGRTGTFIAIDQCAREMESRGFVDPLQVVEKLRQARGGMVQHPQQYEFVYRACVEFAKAMQRPLEIIGDEEGTSATMLETPPGSVSSKPGAWKQSVKSKKPHVLASLIASGKPEDMPEEEWQKANRKFVKQQASVRAANSIRRTLDPAEMHGELRLGTLSGGTNDGKYRPTAKEVFAHISGPDEAQAIPKQ